MLRIHAVALAIASTFVVTSAFAAPCADTSAQSQCQARTGRVGHGHGEKQNFPMKGAEFKAKIDQRVGKARTRLDEGITKRKLDDAKAKEVRARFEEGVVRLNEEVKMVIADDVVTADEAKGVRELSRALRPHRKHD